MLKVEKKRIIEIIEMHPTSLIGREILLNRSSVKIDDVNLKCNMIHILNPVTKEQKWINVNDLEDETVFDNLDPSGQDVTIKTILGLMPVNQ